MSDTSDQTAARVDYGFWAIVSLVVVIALWLLMMPWVPAIASATMHRFHLRTGSFVLWAIQQPIPSMYNFANRYEVREIPPGMLPPILDDGGGEKRYMNHFPTRAMTFANTRYRFLRDRQDRWFHLDSSYRGQRIESRYHIKPTESGGFEMILLPSDDAP